MRILGGTYRGRRLAVAADVRPSESRVREALFSIWSDLVEGCRFLDLFAGSGGVGLEALSRGARSATFVERDPRVLAVLRRNLGVAAPGSTQLLRLSLPAQLGRRPVADDERYDLIFADPPYHFERYEALLAAAEHWLAPGGEMVIEHSRRVEPASAVGPWRRREQRRYGDSCLGFYVLRNADPVTGPRNADPVTGPRNADPVTLQPGKAD
ncbi:MAG: 16S rRNA (guanine(966)-N(2))-methyltransferase RsmD [bacterium]|nr:16S rRNA (guanine(966)-N(2))-methyltransferase RsmD [bacterium]